MSSIVFQDLRESQGLAYSVYSSYSMPKKNNDIHFSVSYMSTQVQKLSIAIEEFIKLIDNMPISEDTFNNTKKSIQQKICSNRITKKAILEEYEKLQKLGIEHDIRRDIYSQLSSIQLKDIIDFQKNHIANRNKVIMILGPKDKIDLSSIKMFGEIEYLKFKDIFGY